MYSTDAAHKSSQKGCLELEDVYVGKKSSTVITVEPQGQSKKEFIETSVDQAEISEISKHLTDSNVVLIIDRNMENVVSNGECISNTWNLGFKETIFIIEKEKCIQGNITSEVRQHLERNSFLVIKRSISFNKSDKTGKFEKIVDKQKLMVNKEMLPKLKSCQEGKQFKDIYTVNLQNIKARESEYHLTKDLPSMESVNLCSLSSSVIAVNT